MLAIELIKIVLGVGAYVLAAVGIVGLIVEKGDSGPANAALIGTAICLILMFNI